MSTAKSSKSVDAAREAGAMGPPEKRDLTPNWAKINLILSYSDSG